MGPALALGLKEFEWARPPQGSLSPLSTGLAALLFHGWQAPEPTPPPRHSVGDKVNTHHLLPVAPP